ncbi:MAG TPA: sugar transferase, partial [Candidatus Kapabacteria bacterium]
LDRFSHRAAKRLLDLAVSLVVLPFAALRTLFHSTHEDRERKQVWLDVLRGTRTLVGVEDRADREAYYPKPGLTSLAAVTANREWRAEDIRQFDHYYARNHTIGMDCEILLKAVFSRALTERNS